MSPRRYLLLALALCAALYAASLGTRRIAPAHRDAAAQIEGAFTRDGQHPGEPFARAPGVRAWGSWSGHDDNEGSLAIGPFPAPRILRFALGGYPDKPGNQVFVELAGTAAGAGNTAADTRLPVASPPVGERWEVVDIVLPAAWAGRPIRLVAIDQSKGVGGWLALTEPIRGGRGDGNNALI
jgi:hypothetical protein